MSKQWLLNKKSVFFVGLVLIFFTSCKKDRLVGEAEVLVGEWEWAYTVRTNYNPKSTYRYVDTLTPKSEGDSYSMVFLKKGKACLMQNEEVIKRGRTVIGVNSGFGGSTTGNFEIMLNNDPNERLAGYMILNATNPDLDTLLNGPLFPFDFDENCHPSFDNCYHAHYFVRK